MKATSLSSHDFSSKIRLLQLGTNGYELWRCQRHTHRTRQKRRIEDRVTTYIITDIKVTLKT